MKPIWIVDDDQSIRFVLEKALAREQFQVRCFATAREMLAALDGEEPQVLVSDIRMPGLSGIELLAKVKARLPGLPVIIMTAYSDLDSAVSAFQGGAFEYLPKPFDVDEAVAIVRRALAKADESLLPPPAAEAPRVSAEIIGAAPAMQEVFRAIEIGIGRHDDHRQRGRGLLDLVEQREPVRARHADVGDDDVGSFALQARERLVGALETVSGDRRL